MIEGGADYAPLLLIMGGVTLAAPPARAALGRVGLPGLVGFILLGVALAAADARLGFLTADLEESLALLSRIGIVALLFRIGLESDLGLLADQLGAAAVVWGPNMALSAVLVFLVVVSWPGLGAIPAVFAAIAASATSIGVSVAAWEEVGALDTREGALLVDTAELDDLSAAVLLSILFAAAPAFAGQTGADAFVAALGAGALQLLEVAAFCALCYGFSRLAERRLSRAFARLDARLGPFLFAVGATFVIAALADRLGFSIAIGAFFAGLAFSRDPSERQIEDAFAMLLAVFGPFFFLAIGLSVEIGALAPALGLGAALCAAAVAGKVVGAGVPAALLLDRPRGLLIGASMVPRAEIFLIVLLHGLSLGDWAVPPTLYAAGVMTCVATCVIGPAMVSRGLRRLALAEEAR
jgi:Kef-type K+ transport system membrane component KefB